MTDREKAIVMAYTGSCMLEGDKISIFYKYVEHLMERPLCTLEIGLLADEIKEKSKPDFLKLCSNEVKRVSENKNLADNIRKMVDGKPEGTFEDMLIFQCAAIAVALVDISKSLALIADKAESEENEYCRKRGIKSC